MLGQMVVEEGSTFYTLKKALELGIGAVVSVWHKGNAYLNCSQSVLDELKLLSGDNEEIIFFLRLERIAITNWQPRCRFIIESVEREVPAATLTPQPTIKRRCKNVPKKKSTNNAIVTELTSSIDSALSSVPEIPDLRDLDAFLTANDVQTRE